VRWRGTFFAGDNRCGLGDTSTRIAPNIQLRTEGVNRALSRVLVAMDRQAFVLFPSLDGSDFPAQVGSDFFPRLEPILGLEGASRHRDRPWKF
jgi:hypothetical protein